VNNETEAVIESPPGWWWLRPPILTSWEAEIGRIEFSAAWANSLQDPISKKRKKERKKNPEMKFSSKLQ
jgi:hypothetical protein